MYAALDCMAVLAASTLFGAAAVAETARDARGPSPLVAIENEAPARPIVDPKQSIHGCAMTPYQADGIDSALALWMQQRGSRQVVFAGKSP